MVKYEWIRTTILIGSVLFLTACDRAGGPTLPDELSPQPAATLLIGDTLPEETQISDVQMTQPAQPFPSSKMASLIEKAKEDLAKRLSIEVTEIDFLEAREVVWPDSSLGCPQPGMRYLQIPEDGALILLQVQGVVYEYHNGGTRGLFLCETVYKDPNPLPKIDITDLTPRLLDNKPPPASTPDNSIPPGEDQ